MLTEEHIRTARYSLDESEREFAAGEVLQGSEKLWGAASHAVMAIAQQRDWPYNKHNSLKVAVRRLAQESEEGRYLLSGFAIAEAFHANFYHDFMENFQLEDRILVRDFVNLALTFTSESDNGE
jgi:hypothetical protein